MDAHEFDELHESAHIRRFLPNSGPLNTFPVPPPGMDSAGFISPSVQQKRGSLRPPHEAVPARDRMTINTAATDGMQQEFVAARVYNSLWTNYERQVDARNKLRDENGELKSARLRVEELLAERLTELEVAKSLRAATERQLQAERSRKPWFGSALERSQRDEIERLRLQLTDMKGDLQAMADWLNVTWSGADLANAVGVPEIRTIVNKWKAKP